jgi:hypothetical protein
MQKYESEFEYLQASFVTSLSIYRNSLEELLLSALALSDAQLHQLLKESDSQAWDNPDLVCKLRDRLASSYLPFKSSVKQLHKKVNLFGRKLQLDARLKVSFPYLRQKLANALSRHGSLMMDKSTFRREIASSGIL